MRTPFLVLAALTFVTPSPMARAQQTDHQVPAQIRINRSSIDLTSLPGGDDSAIMKRAIDNDSAATTALSVGRYADAEAAARQALAAWQNDTRAMELLARSLVLQGKLAEGEGVYRTLADDWHCQQPPVLLRYVLLLLPAGRWAEAVTAYNTALPLIPHGSLPWPSERFDPATPQPVAMAALAHIGLGLEEGFYTADHPWDPDYAKRLDEYQRAFSLAPDWDIVTFYYAAGLHDTGQRKAAKALADRATTTGSSSLREAYRMILGPHVTVTTGPAPAGAGQSGQKPK